MSTAESEQFVVVAKQFVDFAEEHSVDLGNERQRLESVLACLYSKAVMLPVSNEVTVTKMSESVDFTKERVKRRFQSLPFRYYTKILDPHSDADDEMITSDLLEELLNIYSEIKSGLALWELGAQCDAVSYWSHSFQRESGRQMLNALTALHTFFETDKVVA